MQVPLGAVGHLCSVFLKPDFRFLMNPSRRGSPLGILFNDGFPVQVPQGAVLSVWKAFWN